MKLVIAIVAVLICASSYAGNLTSLVEVEADKSDYFYPLEGNAVRMKSVERPTDSNFFIYEDGEAYLSHVEKSQERLRHIVFSNERFKVEKTSVKLKKPLYWSLTEIHSLEMRDITQFRTNDDGSAEVLLRSEKIDGCGEVKFYALVQNRTEPRPPTYDDTKLVIPNVGSIVISSGHVEYMKCTHSGEVIVGYLYCGAHGWCGQTLMGVALKHR